MMKLLILCSTFALLSGLLQAEKLEPLIKLNAKPYIGLSAKDFADFDPTSLAAKIPYYVVSHKNGETKSLYLILFDCDLNALKKASDLDTLMQWLYPHEAEQNIKILKAVGIVEFRDNVEYSIQHRVGIEGGVLLRFAKKIMHESGYIPLKKE